MKKYTSLKGLNINNLGFQPRVRKGEYDTVRDEANIEKQTFCRTEVLKQIQIEKLKKYKPERLKYK